MAERRLGRGLDFLISRTTPPSAVPVPLPPAGVEGRDAGGPRMIPLAAIVPNPFQPRREFAPEALADLEQSIRRHGVLQPVVLRASGGGFEVVAGERRLRAAGMAGLTAIPAVVREVTDGEMLTLALVENLQREDLNPIETALAYRDLLATPGLTQEDVARLVGKSRPTIANALRLLDLPADIQECVSRGTLSAGHGRAILMCTTLEGQASLARRILEEGLSVREAESLAQGGTPRPLRPVRTPRERSSHLDELEGALRATLGGRVRIQPGRGKKGKIVLYYASLEDFDRLFELLAGPRTEAPARTAV